MCVCLQRKVFKVPPVEAGSVLLLEFFPAVVIVDGGVLPFDRGVPSGLSCDRNIHISFTLSRVLLEPFAESAPLYEIL